MKERLTLLSVLILALSVHGCGKNSSPTASVGGTEGVGVETPKAQADAMLFARIVEQVDALIKVNQFSVASERIKQLESMNLTSDQQAVVARLKAQIHQ